MAGSRSARSATTRRTSSVRSRRAPASRRTTRNGSNHSSRSSPTSTSRAPTRSATPKRRRSWRSSVTAAVPRHIAIVMDGNRRWARGRHLPVIAGHRQGVETIRRTVKAARDRGVEYVTLYSFSTENWKRDPDEVGGLMKLLEETIRRETPTLVQDGVRLRIIGRLQELSDGVRRAIDEAAHATDAGKNGTMTIAFNYGGRAEIVDAVKRLRPPGRRGRGG